MITFTWKKCVALAVCLMGWNLHAAIPLASTNVGGLQVKVVGMYRSGDSRNLDCSIHFEFAGDKFSRAVSVSPIKIIEAVDDTGMNLIRTNHLVIDYWPATTTRPAFWPTVEGLKTPAPNAKTIRRLSGEVKFAMPTADTPVLTNFMSKPNEILRHPMLEKNHVKIVFNSEMPNPPGSLVIDGNAGKSIPISIDDPDNKVAAIFLQKADGSILDTNPKMIEVNHTTNGKHTDFTYIFQKEPPRGLNLIVYLSKPEATDTVRFDLENVRLPWVNLPQFEATANVPNLFVDKNTKQCFGTLLLSFAGGPMTNAVGIRRLWIDPMMDDTGRPVQVGYIHFTNGTWLNHFDQSYNMGAGVQVQKTLPIFFQSASPKKIAVINGQAEWVDASAKTNGTIIVNDFMNHPGALNHPLLEKCHVKLAYLGTVNYATRREELKKTSGVSESGQLLQKESPSGEMNALEFTVNDPDNAIISSGIEFLDEHGRSFYQDAVMISGNVYIYRFKTLPSPKTQLQLRLAIPESLHRIPFRIENIPLNETHE